MPDSDPAADPLMPPAGPALHRVLGLWMLVFYGLGSIIGAGIYVLVGEVAATAGHATPFAFVLAGVLAALTGLSYAELSARFPEAAGAAAYVHEAFALPWLSRMVGFAVVAVGLFLVSSLARGAVGYIDHFVAVPETPAALALIAGFTAIACVGVAHSLRLAALMSLIEVGGLVLVIAAGVPTLPHLPEVAPLMVPRGAAAWEGVLAGAFFAFFAFLGFEDIVNMAEETRNPERTLPRAILLAIGLSTALYFLVAVVAVLMVPMEKLAGSRAPLEAIMASAAWAPKGLLAAIALVAIPNGILITVVMLARILYGMARRGWLPAALAQVNGLTRTPLRTTLVVGVLALALTWGVSFARLVALTSAVNLVVFVTVNLALWRLHRVHPHPGIRFRAPRWVPPLAAACALWLLVAELAR